MPDGATIGDILPPPRWHQPTGTAKRKFILHGRLRKRFGKEFNLGASTGARGIQTLCTLIPDFREELQKGEYRIVIGPMKKGHQLDVRGLALLIPEDRPFHIIPVGKGRKGSGASVGKIIIGVILVVAAFVLPVAAPALFGSIAAVGGTGGSILAAGTILGTQVLSGLALFGGAMIIGGISGLISSQPQQQAANTASFLLGGQLNVAQEGTPVPVIYGRAMVGSVVVSTGYEASLFVNPGNEAGTVSPDGNAGFSGALFDSNNVPQKPGTPPGTTIAGTGTGGGGKKGGGGGVEAPNTLRSMATIRIVDVLSEGPIKGLVDGPKGIFLNNTPLMANDGQWNFRGVSWTLRFGWPDQDPVPGFAAAEETIPIGQNILFSNPVIQTVNSNTATAIRVTMQIPALFATDTKSGNVNVTNVNYMIEIRPSREADDGSAFTGSYILAINDVVHGKCTSPYERSYRFNLPGRSTDGGNTGANTWDIRVSRLTPDSTTTALQNSCVWQLLSVITDHNLMYSDTAYIALEIDAAAFRQGTIPTRTYLIDGRLVQVPLNYDASRRVYNAAGPGTTGGTWDSISFQSSWTDNSAWNFYDMVSHPRYGGGVDSGSLEGLRASLYVISQYCDETIPDGFGGGEPRYRTNAVINARVEAYTMFQTMVAAFRGMTYWGSGQVLVSADMPKRPIKLVNQANVIGGNFVYQGTSLKSRHNMIRVTWRDPNVFYRPAIEVVELTQDISVNGFKPIDIVAWGCTSRGQAHRVGKWMLYTEHNQTEGLEYDGGPYHFDLRPGDIFQQHDPSYVGIRWGGRLRATSTQSLLQLDSLLENPEGAAGFDLTVVMPDNSVAERPISIGQISTSPDGSHSIIDLTSAPLPAQPMPNAEWIALDTFISERFFQTIMMGTDTPGQYHISSIAYDPNKFAIVELGLNFPVNVYSLRPLQLNAAIPPPSNVSAQDYLLGIGNTTVLRVTVSWQAPSDISRVRHYEVAATSATFQQSWEADMTSYNIDNLKEDTYAFAVRSVGKNGEVSAWVSSPDVVVDGLTDPPQQVLSLTAVGGTRRVWLNWQANDERFIKYYEVQRAPAVGADPGLPLTPGNPGAPGSWATIAHVSATSFLDAQSDLLYPNTIWWYRVRAITTTDVPGTYSDPAWAKTTLLIVDDLNDGIINTAKFASSLKPVQLINDLSAPGLLDDMAFNKADGQLYHYEAGPPAGWYPLVDIGATSGYITETQIADDSISSPKLRANSVIAGKIAANAVIAGTIQAGAVRATEIAAGEIRTTHLAADFQLTRSAQIGTAVIGTAQIDYLAVGTSNIKGGAVSAATSGSGGISMYPVPAPTWIYITSDEGMPIMIWGTAYCNVGTSDGSGATYPGTVLTPVQRVIVQTGGVTPLTWLQTTGVGATSISFTIMDQPGIGTFGYSIGGDGTMLGSFTLIALVMRR